MRGFPQGLLMSSITKEDNCTLCGLASMDELNAVVRHLSPNRAPGFDGFNGAFYKASWPIISSDLLEAINNALRSGHLLPQINHTILCLVPKKVVPESVDDFRLIVLCTVLYRILSKVLSNRLKSLLPKIIDHNQSAFNSGRRITDSILLAHEICYNLHSGQGRAHMCIKLDLRKAFDSMNRTFIGDALQSMGFAP